jgi:hypothetical protein
MTAWAYLLLNCSAVLLFTFGLCVGIRTLGKDTGGAIPLISGIALRLLLVLGVTRRRRQVWGRWSRHKWSVWARN